MQEGDAGTQPAMLTSEVSRMSMLSGMDAFEHSRMSSAGAPLNPEEIAEWRGAGNSSCGEILSSSREVSLDVPGFHIASQSGFLAGHGHSRCGLHLPPLDASRDAADRGEGPVTSRRASPGDATTQLSNITGELLFTRSCAIDVETPSHSEPPLQAQWMQIETSSSSSSDAADAGAPTNTDAGAPCYDAVQGTSASKCKKPPGGKGAAKGKGGCIAGGVGAKSGKEGAKGAKGAQAGVDGDGKLSGMWTADENNIFFAALAAHGRTFPKIHDPLQRTKTKEQVRCYYYRVIKKINQVLPPPSPVFSAWYSAVFQSH